MLQGAYTAIITPFNGKGEVDYDCFKRLIHAQINAGVAGIVPVGTTGESATLDYDEHKKIIDVAVETCNHRIQVIAGTGANCTAEAMELTRHAIKAGADATLQVCPYYNKPNQEGLYRHFSQIADMGLPIVLYNVPGRTGREIAVDTIVKLAAHPKITAIKESGGSIERVNAIIGQSPITVLAGDDFIALTMMLLGARGVVSVASNVVPADIAAMIRLALAGEWKAARDIHFKYWRLFSDLFVDSNPIPVKYALSLLGQAQEVYRLPMCPMNEANKTILRKTLQAAGLLP